MHAQPIPVIEPPPRPTRAQALTDAFVMEARLLDELKRVLLSQRDGLAANDIAALDDSVFSAQRLFLTLQQARRRRRSLLELTTGDQELKLSDLQEAMGGEWTAALEVARDALSDAAKGLHRELDVNRRVLDGALHVGDQIIRTLAGASEPGPVYKPAVDPQGRTSGGSGTLFNHKV